MPVSVTIPMIKPTQAQATATDTDRFAPSINASSTSLALMRVVLRHCATIKVEAIPQKPENTAE
ncbi:Uncharacterised protein [uncultured Blautia sp.]|nr:Uncharacterised protein [uncultured Blautia sp.]